MTLTLRSLFVGALERHGPGGAKVPVNDMQSAREIAYLLRDSGSIFIAVAFAAVTVWFEGRELTLALGISGG